MIKRFAVSKRTRKMFRGMLSYGILWPASCLVEQKLLEKRTLENYDWKKCLQYSLYGSFFIAPTLFLWIRVAASMWPRTDFKSSLCKGLTEQAAVDPFGHIIFLYSMSIMEGKTHTEAKKEVKNKFFGIFRVGVIYWPAVQTLNFMFVPLRNQVIITSIFSFIWTTYLSFMKSTQLTEDN